MYISLYDLGLFILFAVALVVAIYLIIFLRRAIGVAGRVKEILDEHGDNIEESLALLPETLANVNALAVTLKETADQTSSAMQTLQDDLVGNLRDGLETFAIYAKIIGDIVRAVFSKAA